ncbi:MAG: hypothetical protein NVSMB64_23880 [Candidatus Velthaea sp.]
MKPQRTRLIPALLGLALLAGCGTGTTSNNTAVPPIQQSVNPVTSNVLTLAVGTANFPGAPTGGGLNVVSTLRQANGLTGILVDTPSLTGPFTVPAVASAYGDAGTNTISGQPQSSAYAATFTQTNTLGVAGGVFGSGIAPENINPLSTSSGFTSTNSAPSFALYAQPLYLAAPGPNVYRAGPPAWPQVRDGTYPAGFIGYSMGFLTFNIAAPAGTYTLNVTIPTSASSNAIVTAGATLPAGAPVLPLLAPPAFTPDGTGGGTIAYAAPPAAITEAFAIVQNTTGKCFPGSASAAFYTVKLAPGSTSAIVPDNLGPTIGTGSTHSVCTSADSAAYNAANGTTGGDKYSVYLVGADYPLMENVYPLSTVQKPVFPASADITLSAATAGQAP